MPDALNRNIDTYQIAVLEGRHAFVVVKDRDLYESKDDGVTWTRVEENFPRISSLLAVAGD